MNTPKMMERIVTTNSLLLLAGLFTFAGNAHALREEFERWVPKGYVSVSSNKMTPTLMPKKLVEKVEALEAYNKKISDAEMRVFQTDQAIQDDYIPKAQRERAAVSNDEALKEVKKLKADKAKIFGPFADELAASINKRARKLGDAWADMAKRTIGANAAGKPVPAEKSAAFKLAEEEMEDLSQKILEGGKIGSAATRAKLGRFGKAAVVVVPLAGAAAVVGSSGEAQAGAIREADLPNKDDVENRQQQDIEVLDAN